MFNSNYNFGDGIKNIFQTTGALVSKTTEFFTKTADALKSGFITLSNRSLNAPQAEIPAQTSYYEDPENLYESPSNYDYRSYSERDTYYEPVAESDVYSDLRNDVSAGYDSIESTDNTTINVDPEKVANFTKLLGQSAIIIGESFSDWLSAYRSIKDNQELVGSAANSSEGATSTIGLLMSRFVDYLSAMVLILPSLTSKIA